MFDSPESQNKRTQLSENVNDMVNDKNIKYLNLFGTFYKLVSSKDGKLTASCQNCNKIISASITSSGYLLSHIKVRFFF